MRFFYFLYKKRYRLWNFICRLKKNNRTKTKQYHKKESKMEETTQFEILDNFLIFVATLIGK